MKKTVFVLFIPIIALLGWIASIEYQIAISQKIRIHIEGYDPRDLLAGHYITFLISTSDKSFCNNINTERVNAAYCLCFIPSSDGIFHEPSWGGSCNNKPESCHTFIRGHCSWNRFTTGAERYSFSENYASVLQNLPKNASADISVTKDGKMKVLQLYAEDKTLEEYAQTESSH